MGKVITQDFIYKYLLPPIVLAEGFNVKSRLFRNYGTEIKILGIGVNFLIPLMLSFCFYFYCQRDWSWMLGLDENIDLDITFLHAYMLAITLTSVDLHGAIGPYHGGIHNERMSEITFGTTLFNNNICLIFVMALEKVSSEKSSSALISNFIKTGALSTVFGFMMGGVISYLMRKARFLNSNPVYEVFVVVIGTYATYTLAHFQYFQLSGDVAIFFYGMVMSNYNIYNMSREAIRQLGVIINVIATGAEAICFIFVGLSFENTMDTNFYNLKLASIIFFLIFGARAFVYFGIVLFKYVTEEKLKYAKGLDCSVRELFALCSAGMIKGPVAYIFGGVLAKALDHDLDFGLDVEEGNALYKSRKPLYVVQLVVILSVLVYPPFHFLVCKIMVKNEHSG